MRIISYGTIRRFIQRMPDSALPLNRWYRITKAARWRNLADVRSHFPHCDLVIVDSRRQVQVFNVGGNNLRLVTAIHFNRGIVYVLKILTHADYDKERWKKEL